MKTHTTKENIIESGITILLEKGYNGAGLQEILKSAGVPKGSFYHFFKNKQDFGKETLFHYHELQKDLLQKWLVDSQEAPLDRLQHFFEAMVEHLETDMACRGGCLVGNLAQELADVDEGFRVQIKSIMQNWRQYFETCLDDAQKNGDISKDFDTTEMAEVLLNSWEGALIKMKVTNSVEPLQSFISVFFRFLTCP